MVRLDVLRLEEADVTTSDSDGSANQAVWAGTESKSRDTDEAL